MGLTISLIAVVILASGLHMTPQRIADHPASSWSWASHGIGTHKQLPGVVGAGRAAPCVFWKKYHLPCPTCGMTTAVSLLTRGQPLCSFLCQPFGFLFGLAAVMAFFIGLFVTARGRWPRVRVSDHLLERLMIVLPALFAVAWAYKVLAMTWLAGGPS